MPDRRPDGRVVARVRRFLQAFWMLFREWRIVRRNERRYERRGYD